MLPASYARNVWSMSACVSHSQANFGVSDFVAIRAFAVAFALIEIEFHLLVLDKSIHPYGCRAQFISAPEETIGTYAL